MDYELVNIQKIESYSSKIDVINALIEKENYTNAMKAVRALIEATGLVVLRKEYNVKSINSRLSWIATELFENGDEFLGNYFNDINGTLNYIYENDEIEKEDIQDMLLKLDDLVGNVEVRYKGIFS